MKISDTRCDIEIFERVKDLDDMRGSPIKPGGLRINGTEVLIPEGTTIEISPMTGKHLVQLTLTVFPTSLRIRPIEDEG